jgi:hypothetical protein
MTAISVITLAGLLLGLTGTALAADNRIAYFGDPSGTEAGKGVLDVSAVTAGNVFTIDVRAENLRNNSLTHSIVAVGNRVTERPDWDETAMPSLPADYTVLGASATAGTCSFDAAGASCDVGTLVKGTPRFVTFFVQAGAAGEPHIWASLRVAENQPNQGDNNNSFFADSDLVVGATDSDNESTYKRLGELMTLSTKDNTGPSSDKMRTTVTVPLDDDAGVISIVEREHTQSCPNTACIGQELTLNVRDGALLDPYVEIELVIVGVGAGSNRGGVVHTDNDGNLIDDLRFTKNNMCTKVPVPCIVSYEINKKAVPATTTIVVRFQTNGKIRAN